MFNSALKALLRLILILFKRLHILTYHHKLKGKENAMNPFGTSVLGAKYRYL